MLPLIDLGLFKLHLYPLFTLVGFVFALKYVVKRGSRHQLDQRTLVHLGFVALVTGLLGARALYVAVHWNHFRSHPLEAFQLWQGGLIFYGGLILLLPSVWAFSRLNNLNAASIMRVFLPALALAHIWGRLGCFAAGCCYGCSVTIGGVEFTHPESVAPLGVPLLPVQLYEALGLFVLFMVLDRLEMKNTKIATLAATYFVGYGLLRLITEFGRNDNLRGFVGDSLSLSQWISLFLITMGFVMWTYTRLRSQRSLPSESPSGGSQASS